MSDQKRGPMRIPVLIASLLLIGGGVFAQRPDSLWRAPLSRTLRDRFPGLPPQRQHQDSTLLHEAWLGISTGADRSLRVDASGMFDSNALRNELALGLWRGERLGRELRQRSDAANDADGRAGYALDMGLLYRSAGPLCGRSGLRFIAAAGFHDVMGVRYTEDLYRMTFFGNAAYEDRTAELGGSSLMRMRYQTIGMGMEWRRSGSYLMLEAVNGQQLTWADVDRGDLFTAIDGRYLRLDLDGRYGRTAMGPDNGLRSNGAGAALSARVNVPVHLAIGTGVLSVEARDVGVIAWHSNSLRVDRDTVILYQGIRVSDVLDLDQALVGNGSLQDTLGLGYTEQGFTTLLPFSVSATLNVEAAHAMTYTLGADLRGLPGYLPRVRIGARHVFQERNALSAEAAYGGFGGLRIGVRAERVVARGLWLSLGTTNAVGFLSERARGMSAQLTAEWRW